MKRMILIMSCLILFVISTACVAAADINQTADTQKTANFTDLQTEIDEAPSGATINLESDYSISKTISIKKPITINGNGHIIDASGQCGIFHSFSDNVILTDITFKNANDYFGSAVYFEKNSRNSFISNCSVSGIFTGNVADMGGVVEFGNDAFNCSVSGIFSNNRGYSVYFDANASDCTISASFINNTAGDSVVNFRGNVLNSFISSNFTDNSASGNGAGLFFLSEVRNSKIKSNFTNNHANLDGGAIMFWRDIVNSEISGNFKNNSAKGLGGAICLKNAVNSEISGNFTDNSAYYGGAIYSQSIDDSAISADFKANYALDNGGAIYSDNAVNSNISGNFRDNHAKFLGHAIFIESKTLNCRFSGIFINNSRILDEFTSVGDAIDLWRNVSNVSIDNSIFLKNSLSGSINSSYGDICWYGNNANNFNVRPFYNAGSWLFLDSSVTPQKTSGKFAIELNLNSSYDSTGKIIDLNISNFAKDFTFNLSAVNGTVDKNSCLLGEKFIFTLDKGKHSGIVNVSYEGISYLISIGDMVIYAPDLIKYYGGSEMFTLTIVIPVEPVSGKIVSFDLNGKKYYRSTDKDGMASLGVNLNVGLYTIVSEIEGLKVKSNITIKATVNGTDVVKVYRNATQYYATFRDSQGNYLKEGTVVTFNINGVMYERKISGSAGLAKLNLNLEQGNYVITATNPETGENAANNITIISRLIENRDITKYYRNGTQYTVKVLGDGGKAVGAGETVIFNINGVMYNRQTNESGIAKLNLNLQPDDYIITAEYKDCKVSNKIKILPVLSAEDISMKYRDGTQFVATLVDSLGNPYFNQKVDFNINGVMYYRHTDISGQAKLNINLQPGKYIITSSYNGANIANTVTISA